MTIDQKISSLEKKRLALMKSSSIEVARERILGCTVAISVYKKLKKTYEKIKEEADKILKDGKNDREMESIGEGMYRALEILDDSF